MRIEAPAIDAGPAAEKAVLAGPPDPKALAAAAPLELSVARDWEDEAWDDFLITAPGGHHAQSSGWAFVKAIMGCRPVRVLARRNGEIVAGAQMLVKRVGPSAAVGYVPKGPAAREGESEAAGLVLKELKRAARQERVRLLLVQPSNRDTALAERLPSLGFAPSPFELSPTATCVIDLSRSEEELLAAMKQRKRYNLRLAQRRGVTVRAGDERDLDRFYRLHIATAQRQNFVVYPEHYVRRLWNAFARRGCARLMLAEHQGETVSGVLAIAFNDTVVYKVGGWSGVAAEVCPNELMHWSTMTWAKAAGYRWYDFDGIKSEGARAILRGEPLPDELKRSVTSFKLGFGSQPLLLPITYDCAPSPLLGWAYRSVVTRMLRSSWLRTAAYRWRTRAVTTSPRTDV
jgi:lipid II:glycine glycyltransferase (peptidoglycan interpeptide bridge formation enzyme)